MDSNELVKFEDPNKDLLYQRNLPPKKSFLVRTTISLSGGTVTTERGANLVLCVVSIILLLFTFSKIFKGSGESVPANQIGTQSHVLHTKKNK